MSCYRTLNWVSEHKRAVRLLCIAWPITLHTVLCSVPAALQKVAHQTAMTAEQRADEANWFRKIGNHRCSCVWFEILLALSFCTCAHKQLGTQLCSARRPLIE